MARLRVWFMMARMERVGGAELVVRDLIRHLDRERFEPVQVLLYDKGSLGEELEREGVATYSGFASSRKDLRIAGRLARLAREQRPDIVCTTESAMPMIWTSYLKRKGLIGAHVAAFHATHQVSRSAKIAAKLALPTCDRLVVLSPTNLEYWLKTIRYPKEKYAVILNGVDTEFFVPPRDRLAVRRELGLDPEKLTVGTIAHWSARKNLGLFIEVAKGLLEQGLDLQFVLAGDGPERETIHRLVKESGWSERFLLPGMVIDPVPFHQACDLGMLTSNSEGLPLAVIEANACGVPVVSTDVGGVRDTLIEGETGYVTPVGDKCALLERAGDLLRNPDLLASMGARARDRAVAEFSVGKMVGRYSSVFDELARKGR